MKVKKSKIYLVNQSARRFWQKKINSILNSPEELLVGSLASVIKNFYYKNRQTILKLVKKKATPFYLFDEKELIKSINSFKQAFNKHLADCHYYYAVKVNWHPEILKTAVKQGMGLDVSSARELNLALRAGAKRMVYSGPGKSEADLRLALLHREKIIINLDSWQELDRLGKLSTKLKQEIVAGVRIFTKIHGPWSKFGIPLVDLKSFWRQAENYPFLKLTGVQSHLSWNKDALSYQKIIKEIGDYLKRNFSQTKLASFKFIDLGGGWLPYQTTAYYPWGTAHGGIIQKASEYLKLSPKFSHKYYLTESVPLESYAQGISIAVRQYLKPLINCKYFTEPGRIICNNVMHLVLRIIDVKSKNSIVLDGGVNLVGWEGLRYDYTPIINLNNFSEKEINCLVFGCLCMPDDIWSYSCFTNKVNIGDVIVIPFQGDYTYSLAQNFIKPIP